MNDQILVFKYKNYKGEVSTRHVKPQEIWWGATKYHPEIQWLLTGYDFDKGGMRDFAMNDIMGFIKGTKQPEEFSQFSLGLNPTLFLNRIEKALGMTLYLEQRQYLLDPNHVWKGNRQSGHTTAYIIKLLLSEGEGLRLSKIEEFSDRTEKNYNKSYFLPILLEVQAKLRYYGFKVRDLIRK